MRHSPKKQGTERDLGTVYRRTPRKQIANCIRGCENHDRHVVRVPFFRIFLTMARVYTIKTGSVKGLHSTYLIREIIDPLA